MTSTKTSEGRGMEAEAVPGMTRRSRRWKEQWQIQKGSEARGTGQKIWFTSSLWHIYKRRMDLLWWTSVEGHRPQGYKAVVSIGISLIW